MSYLYNLDQGIALFGLKAEGFPHGVKESFIKLHKMVQFNENRLYMGLSKFKPEGGLEYICVASELYEGEFNDLNLQQVSITSGNYLCDDIEDFMNHIDQISKTFQELIKDNRFDPENWAIEWYEKDVCKCMVKLRQ